MPAKHNSAPVQQDETGYERLVFFSDAVMAIAITLLALEVRLPATVTQASQLRDALIGMYPQILAYFISFFVIGTFWIGHHRIFTNIRRYDRALMWINLLFLSLIAIFPFPTAVLGRFGDNTLAVQFYAVSAALAAAARTWIWRHAVKRKLISPDVTPTMIQRDMFLGIITVIVFMVSFGIAFFNPSLAMLFWIVLFVVLMILQRRIYGRAEG